MQVREGLKDTDEGIYIKLVTYNSILPTARHFEKESAYFIQMYIRYGAGHMEGR